MIRCTPCKVCNVAISPFPRKRPCKSPSLIEIPKPIVQALDSPHCPQSLLAQYLDSRLLEDAWTLAGCSPSGILFPLWMRRSSSGAEKHDQLLKIAGPMLKSCNTRHIKIEITLCLLFTAWEAKVSIEVKWLVMSAVPSPEIQKTGDPRQCT